MIASILIIVVSLVLFAYWFRYTCILMLSTEAESPVALRVAAVNRLNFPKAQDKLRQPQMPDDLNSILASLEHDYRVISYLQQHAAALGGDSLEQTLLSIDFKVMKMWYRMVRTLAPVQARQSVLEMASILNHFAEQMGQRAAQNSAA